MKRALSLLLLVTLLLPLFSAAAWDDPILIAEAQLPQETRYVLDSGTYRQGMTVSPFLYILTEDADGLRHVTIFQKDNGYYYLNSGSAPLPAVNGIKPSLIAGFENFTLQYGEGLAYTFSLNHYGGWNLTGVTAESSYRCTRYRLIEPGVGADRAIAGNRTTITLTLFDPAHFPAGFDRAVQSLETDGYALVSNPDPADRLHLRAAPDKQAVSKGKYYSGTPVYVTQDLGDWVKVMVANVEGYMMKQYLAFGMDMLNVQAAFPPLSIRESLAGKDITVYLRPDAQSDDAGVLTDRGPGRVHITILGVFGAEWYHIICDNGLIGYLPVSDFGP